MRQTSVATLDALLNLADIVIKDGVTEDEIAAFQRHVDLLNVADAWEIATEDMPVGRRRKEHQQCRTS